MFPMIGNFHGPGGNFGAGWLVLDGFPNLFSRQMNRRKVQRIGKKENWSSMRRKEMTSREDNLFCLTSSGETVPWSSARSWGILIS